MKKLPIAGSLKKFLSFIASAFIILSLSDIMIIRAGSGPDLTIETVELDVNDVPENRYVQLKIRMDNNPGLNTIICNIQSDKRLTSELISISTAAIPEVTSCGGSILNPDEKISSIVSIFNNSEWYYDNGDFVYINFYLPEDYKAGDFYEVKFIDEYNSEETRYTATDGPHYNNESFGTLTSGGIKIRSDQDQEPEKQPDESNEPADNQESESNEPASETQEAQTAAETEVTQVSTSADITTASSAAVSSSASSSVLSSAAAQNTAVTAALSGTSAETSVTSPAAEETTPVPVSSSENKQRSFLLIPVITAVITGVLFTIIKRRKSNEK